MTNRIVNLWLAGNLPMIDGLYRADGSAKAVRVDLSAPGGLALLEPIDVDSLFQPFPTPPPSLANVDFHAEGNVELPGHSGYLCYGEGSWGTEGIFGRVDRDDQLAWVVYLQDSNPFVKAFAKGSLATFISSSDVVITVDLTKPEFGP